MTTFGVLFVLILIVMAALIADHYSRLKKVGWMPEGRPDRSAMDPIGSALGELGRADGVYRLAAAIFGPIGKFSELLYAPIAAGFGAFGKALEMVFAPIGAVLGMVAGAKR
ncbi:MAG: hypothetical protein V4813_05400 [Gemmatimonadota bacterium]